MSLRVIHPGWCTLVVDEGRPGSRSLGVPVGGAADRAALALGNALVGNPPATAALEISLAGPTLQAECQLAVVLFGAPFPLFVGKAGTPLQPGKTFTLPAGEQLGIGHTARGLRAYLCVRSGLQTPQVLGSRSALAPVRAGDVLPCDAGKIHSRFLRPDLGSNPLVGSSQVLDQERYVLHVVAGLQADWFDVKAFFSQEWAVTPASNRMGLRLSGEPLALPPGELVSEPISPGAVQVTRDGQCILLGVDGQTIGGYPKIAHVIGADLDLVGQLRPGEQVRFVPVDLDEAMDRYRQRQQRLNQWLQRLLLTKCAW